MQLPKRINNWFQHAKKYFFTYKEGFFELSFLDNSPSAMIESIMKMPFVSHDAQSKILVTKNTFLEAEMHYQELEEGLWVLFSEARYKANVRYKVIYDEFIPCNYFLLSFSINTNEVLDYATKIQNAVFPSKSWIITKREPHKNSLDIFNFKNSNSIDVCIYFDKSWVEKNLVYDDSFIQSRLNEFFKQDMNYIYLPEISTEYDRMIQDIKTTILTKGSRGVSNLLRLKMEAIGLISTFIEKYKTEKIHDNHIEIPNSDRLRLLKIEKYLCEHLEKKFEGIDALAESFNISPTKLKNDFKLMYGKSVFQYFQEKQMLLAKQMMETDDVRIKELAYKFGYENAGKFSLAYKKYFQILPSEQLKKV
jgi:AraC-like DNA-binding protein